MNKAVVDAMAIGRHQAEIINKRMAEARLAGKNRDELAKIAMKAIVMNHGVDGGICNTSAKYIDNLARVSYEIADAMIRERERAR